MVVPVLRKIHPLPLKRKKVKKPALTLLEILKIFVLQVTNEPVAQSSAAVKIRKTGMDKAYPKKIKSLLFLILLL